MSFASAIRAGRAFVELGLKNNMIGGLRNAQRQLNSFASAMTGIGTKLTGLSLGLAAPIGLAVRTFMGFSDTMLTLKSLVGEGLGFDELQQKAKDLGATTSFTASQVGQAMIELSRGGFTAEETLAGIADTLNLARGGGLELADAANIAVKAIRGLGLNADQTGRVVNVLVAAANSGATNVSEMGEALKFVINTARNAGQSVETVGAALAVMANNAIVGTSAGTSMAQMFEKLVENKDKLEAMGIAIDDGAGGFRDLSDIMADVGKHASGLSEVERVAFFKDIFDIRGGRAAAALAGMSKEFGALFQKMHHVEGSSAKMSETMNEGLGGTFRTLMSVLEAVQISLGEALEEPLKRIGAIGQKYLGFLRNWIDNNQALVRTIVGVIAGAGGVGVVLTILGGVLSAVASAFAGLAVVGGTILTVITGLLGASKIAIVLGSVGAAAGLAAHKLGMIQQAVDFVSAKFAQLRQAVTPAFEAIFAAISQGRFNDAFKVAFALLKNLFVQVVSRVKALWAELKFQALRVWHAIANSVSEVLGGIRADILSTILLIKNEIQSLKPSFEKMQTWLVSTFTGLNKELVETAIRMAAVKDQADPTVESASLLAEKFTQFRRSVTTALNLAAGQEGAAARAAASVAIGMAEAERIAAQQELNKAIAEARPHASVETTGLSKFAIQEMTRGLLASGGLFGVPGVGSFSRVIDQQQSIKQLPTAGIQGTFSGHAARIIGSAKTVDDKIEENTRKTKEELADVRKWLIAGGGGLVFTGGV